MQKILIKHPSPHILSLSPNPEFYWERFVKIGGVSIVWFLISLARLLHSEECRTSMGAYVIFGLSVLIPGIVCVYLYKKFKATENGHVVEFNELDRTIFFSKEAFFHFEDVKQIQVKMFSDIESGDCFTIYLELRNGKDFEIETFDTFRETRSVAQVVSKILKLPVVRLKDDGRIRFSLGMKWK